MAVMGVGRARMNSCRADIAWDCTWLIRKEALLILSWLWWNQIVHTNIANSSRGEPESRISCTTSTKLENWWEPWNLQLGSESHVPNTDGHDHNACRTSSACYCHCSLTSSVRICHQTTLVFVGMVFLHAHQIKFLTLFGTWRPHTCFHNACTWPVCAVCWSGNNPSWDRNLYPDLTEYVPVGVWGQIFLNL